MTTSSQTVSGGGSVYFQNSRNSELSELQTELNSLKIDQQKEAMKQIIASMTIGKDVSPLFPHVVKCMRTNNIDLKKLIYLYIINYAKSKPDLTILAVSAFHTDAHEKSSPLVRALAVRTMGCIRIDTIISYLCETLKDALKDEDAYVRKTACICVAKLYNTSPSIVKDNGFIQTLTSMLTDGNAIVVANALAALAEVTILSGDNLLKFRSKTLKRILAALNESNEWGQVYILDSLAAFTPKKSKQAEDIIEGVIPRLAHANPAVVMSSIKVILKFLDWIDSVDNVRNYCKKVSNSLMTIMMAGPEIQFVLLKSLHAVVQKRPYLLEKDFKYFYVQYNDPIYVKLEKIDILYKLTDLKNFEAIIGELKNYSVTEFDIDFVKKAIRYIGNIGFKFDKSVDVCVEAIKEILDHNQDFAVSEAIIIARDLMRKYKGKTLDLLKKITGDLAREITEPEAKAALLYIIGEFCMNIPKSTEFINPYITNFADEAPVVKLQILNAIIKNYVNKPDDESETLVKSALKMGGEETENPDVRDRAYVYWRLLESEPDVAKDMIMAEKPSFEFKEEIAFEGTIVDNIIENMTNISAVYHKLSSELIPKEDMVIDKSEEEEKETKEKEEIKGEEKGKKVPSSKKPDKIIISNINQNDVDLIGLGEDNNQQDKQNQNVANPNASNFNNNIFEIFGTTTNTNPQNTSTNNFGGIDLYNPSNNNNLGEFEFVEDTNIIIFDENQGVSLNKPNLNVHNTTSGSNGKTGIVIYSTFHKIKEELFYGMYIRNTTNSNLSDFGLSFKLNSFGIVPVDKIDNLVINSGKHEIVRIKCAIDNEKFDKKPPACPFSIDVAVTSNLDVFIYSVPFLLNSIFSSTGRMKKEVFIEFMKNPNTTNTTFSLKPISVNSTDSLKQILERNNIFLVAQVNKGDNSIIYYSTLINNISNVIEITYPKNGNLLGIKVVSTVNPLIPLIKEVIEFILK